MTTALYRTTVLPTVVDTCTSHNSLIGPPGPQGPPGEKGDTGSQGPAGATGPAGGVVVSAQPNPPTQVLGGLWIDTDETAVYGPKWVQLTQAAYDALSPKAADTLYVVIG